MRSSLVGLNKKVLLREPAGAPLPNHKQVVCLGCIFKGYLATHESTINFAKQILLRQDGFFFLYQRGDEMLSYAVEHPLRNSLYIRCVHCLYLSLYCPCEIVLLNPPKRKSREKNLSAKSIENLVRFYTHFADLSRLITDTLAGHPPEEPGGGSVTTDTTVPQK